MKIKLFDNITVTAEPEEVYMLLKLHHKALQKSEGPKLTITSNEYSTRQAESRRPRLIRL